MIFAFLETFGTAASVGFGVLAFRPSPNRKRYYLSAALVLAATAFVFQLDGEMRSAFWDGAVSASWFLLWWRSGGGDDFKRGKRKLRAKVSALASGRLVVQPA